MTIDELRDLPLWGVLPAAIRKTLEDAESLGWDLHGKGATIAFRLDRDQDELDLPCYVQWEIGVTPKGAISYRSGKAGVPHDTLNLKELLDYLEDPSTVYPLEDEPPPGDAQKAASDLEDTPPWDETATPEQNLSASLRATVIEDKPAPRPLGVQAGSALRDPANRAALGAPPLRVAAPPLRV